MSAEIHCLSAANNPLTCLVPHTAFRARRAYCESLLDRCRPHARTRSAGGRARLVQRDRL